MAKKILLLLSLLCPHAVQAAGTNPKENDIKDKEKYETVEELLRQIEELQKIRDGKKKRMDQKIDKLVEKANKSKEGDPYAIFEQAFLEIDKAYKTDEEDKKINDEIERKLEEIHKARMRRLEEKERQNKQRYKEELQKIDEKAKAEREKIKKDQIEFDKKMAIIQQRIKEQEQQNAQRHKEELQKLDEEKKARKAERIANSNLHVPPVSNNGGRESSTSSKPSIDLNSLSDVRSNVDSNGSDRSVDTVPSGRGGGVESSRSKSTIRLGEYKKSLVLKTGSSTFIGAIAMFIGWSMLAKLRGKKSKNGA